MNRAVHVLELLAQTHEGLTLSELTGQTDIPKSTLFRILATLKHRECVRLREDTNKYQLGFKMWELGSAYIEQSDLDAAATPHMKQLAEACGESVFLGMLDRSEVVYVRRIESPHSVAVVRKLGHRAPAYCTATGMALLAFMPIDEADRLIDAMPFEAHTPKTTVDATALRRRLTSVRDEGVAVVDGEYDPRLLCIAAPVLDRNAQALAALTVAMLSAQARAPQIADAKRQVYRAAQALSREMGYLGNTITTQSSP